jgi:hypothetical protein
MRNYCTVLWLPTIDPLMAGNIIGDYFHFFLKKKKFVINIIVIIYVYFYYYLIKLLDLDQVFP